jgi:hypothetical protein
VLLLLLVVVVVLLLLLLLGLLSPQAPAALVLPA